MGSECPQVGGGLRVAGIRIGAGRVRAREVGRELPYKKAYTYTYVSVAVVLTPGLHTVALPFLLFPSCLCCACGMGSWRRHENMHGM